LPDTDFQEIRTFAERIGKNIRTHTVAEPDATEGAAVTVSLGITSMIDTDISIDTMIKRADDGLYMAKNSGRDRVSWV